MLPVGREIVDFMPLRGEEILKLELGSNKKIITTSMSFMAGFFET